MNLYEYCGGDPVNGIDPEGLVVKKASDGELWDVIAGPEAVDRGAHYPTLNIFSTLFDLRFDNYYTAYRCDGSGQYSDYSGVLYDINDKQIGTLSKDVNDSLTDGIQICYPIECYPAKDGLPSYYALNSLETISINYKVITPNEEDILLNATSMFPYGLKYPSINAPQYSVKDRQSKMNAIFPNGIPANQSEMSKCMSPVKVPIWGMSKSGIKVRSTMRLTVNRALASDVFDIFAEIFSSPERILFNQQNCGGYVYRTAHTASGHSSKLSEHAYGVAIDLNWNSNYAINSSGRIIAGSNWTPMTDPLSIPLGGVVDSAFHRHGWYRGVNEGAFHGYHDYMHYTYTGG